MGLQKSTRLVLFCLTFGGGTLIGGFFALPKEFLGAGLGVFAIFALSWLFSKTSIRQVFLLLMTGLWLGLWWMSFYWSRVPEIASGELAPQPAAIVSPPEISGRYQRFIIKLGSRAKLLVRAPRFPRFDYGQRLVISGKLIAQDELFRDENFDYGKFLLARYGAVGVVEQPAIRSVGFGGNWFLDGLFSFRALVEERSKLIYSPATSSLAQGLILGRSGEFSTSFNQALQRTGTTHLVALSGFNISLIIIVVFTLLKALSRNLAIFCTLGLIVLFVIMTGASPSVVRAALMGGAGLVAILLGRKARPGPVIFVTAFVMLVFNPLVTAYDPSFQLSFLSVLGIVYLGPRIEKVWKIDRLRNQISKTIYQALVATLAAQLATLPLIVGQFGRLSVVSPIVNVLVVPVVQITSIAVIVNALISVIYLPLAQIISLILVWPLQYIGSTIKVFARIPQASIGVAGAGLVIFGVIYLFIIWGMFRGNAKFKSQISKLSPQMRDPAKAGQLKNKN